MNLSAASALLPITRRLDAPRRRDAARPWSIRRWFGLG